MSDAVEANAAEDGRGSLRKKQLLGLTGAAAALALIAVCYADRAALTREVALPSDDPASRLKFVVGWLVWPALTLVVGVQGAARRGFSPKLIDGTRNPGSHAFEINLRYNINTAEQLLLLVIAMLAASVRLAPDRLAMIPLVCVLFVVGRASFWIGYLIHPMGRAFGMVLTAFPILMIYLWLLVG